MPKSTQNIEFFSTNKILDRNNYVYVCVCVLCVCMHACLKAYISLTAIHECINVGIIGGLLTDDFRKLSEEAAAPYIGVEKIIPFVPKTKN